MTSLNLYQKITIRIISMLDSGIVPSRSPILGRSSAGHPKNMGTTKPYRGINTFLLAFTAWSKGYPKRGTELFRQPAEPPRTLRRQADRIR